MRCFPNPSQEPHSSGQGVLLLTYWIASVAEDSLCYEKLRGMEDLILTAEETKP
jgi:hypothetical protein